MVKINWRTRTQDYYSSLNTKSYSVLSLHLWLSHKREEKKIMNHPKAIVIVQFTSFEEKKTRFHHCGLFFELIWIIE